MNCQEKLQKIKSPEAHIGETKVTREFTDFKTRCDMIIANRLTDELSEVAEKVFTPDLFGNDLDYNHYHYSIRWCRHSFVACVSADAPEAVYGISGQAAQGALWIARHISPPDCK